MTERMEIIPDEELKWKATAVTVQYQDGEAIRAFLTLPTIIRAAEGAIRRHGANVVLRSDW